MRFLAHGDLALDAIPIRGDDLTEDVLVDAARKPMPLTGTDPRVIRVARIERPEVDVCGGPVKWRHLSGAAASGRRHAAQLRYETGAATCGSRTPLLNVPTASRNERSSVALGRSA